MEGIYCIEHIESGRKYYGSSMNVIKRLKQHRTDLVKQKHHNIQLQRAIDKHGISNFKFYLIEETQFNNRPLLLKLEQNYLDKNSNGYNMAPANGGDILSMHPDKILIRERIKESHKQTLSVLSTNERKLKFGRDGEKNGNWKNGGICYKLCPICITSKISAKSTHCGKCRVRTKENNPFYNKHHTEETKQLLRELNGGDNSWIKGIDPALLPYTKWYEIQYTSGVIKKVAGLKSIAIEFNVSIENVAATIKRIALGKIPQRGVFKNIIVKVIDSGHSL